MQYKSSKIITEYILLTADMTKKHSACD